MQVRRRLCELETHVKSVFNQANGKATPTLHEHTWHDRGRNVGTMLTGRVVAREVLCDLERTLPNEVQQGVRFGYVR